MVLKQIDSPIKAINKKNILTNCLRLLQGTNSNSSLNGLVMLDSRINKPNDDWYLTCVLLAQKVRSANQSVAVYACQVVDHLFSNHKNISKINCRNLISSLLERSVQKKNIVRDAAMKALDTACRSQAVETILDVLVETGAKNANPMIRASATSIFIELLQYVGPGEVLNTKAAPKFIKYTAKLLIDRLHTTRNNTKEMFRILNKDENFHDVFGSSMPMDLFADIEKNYHRIGIDV